MNITIFVEIFPYKGTQVLNPIIKLPLFKDNILKLKGELSTLFGQNISYIEDVGDNFPKSGVVLYIPYIEDEQPIFLQTINNLQRVIVFNLSSFSLRKLTEAIIPGGVIGKGSIFDDNYPDKFELFIKKDLAHKVEISTTRAFYDLSLLIDSKFKTLPEALAWYIKELDKSGLVKE
jgi:hypothetical protein